MTLCPTCAPRGRCDNPQMCMAEAPSAVMIHTMRCCECGADVDIREVTDGGCPEGAELSDGRWVCSFECWEAVTDRELLEAQLRAMIGE